MKLRDLTKRKLDKLLKPYPSQNGLSLLRLDVLFCYEVYAVVMFAEDIQDFKDELYTRILQDGCLSMENLSKMSLPVLLMYNPTEDHFLFADPKTDGGITIPSKDLKLLCQVFMQPQFSETYGAFKYSSQCTSESGMVELVIKNMPRLFLEVPFTCTSEKHKEELTETVACMIEQRSLDPLYELCQNWDTALILINPDKNEVGFLYTHGSQNLFTSLSLSKLMDLTQNFHPKGGDDVKTS